MVTRQLTINDKKLFNEFNKTILDAITNSEWFIPFSPDDNQVLMPDHDLFLGMFDGDKLVAISGLILTETFYGEIRDVLGLQGKKIAEVGGSMVLPEYRGKNLMLSINKMLVKIAKEQGYEYLVATVHPDNVASRTSAETLGFIKKTAFCVKANFCATCILWNCNI
ncbi:MAG: GNAT family N-acetyltransferase [Clostridia bacterium]|nr:GNAT family N-acetyltransferase [Clostridia bacterium]